MSNGWHGLDPLQRILRAVAVIAFLAMLAVVVADPEKSDNGELLFLLFGSILIALGYPYVMRLPEVFTNKDKDPDEPE